MDSELSTEAQAFLCELCSCTEGDEYLLILDTYARLKDKTPETFCPLLDAHHSTRGWRQYLGMSWDEWILCNSHSQRDWLCRFLLLNFFRTHVYNVDPESNALLITKKDKPAVWLVPARSYLSFGECVQIPKVVQDGRASFVPSYRSSSSPPSSDSGMEHITPLALGDLFIRARSYRRNHPLTFADCLKDRHV